MQIQRLIMDAGSDSFTLDFHNRLTVIAGVGRLEREGLVNELVGALGNSRSGVHLEVVSDAGARFAIFRPEGAHHRVIAIDTAQDVSSSFRSADGTIDVLAKAGMDFPTAKRRMCISDDDLHTSSESERYIEALAEVKQHRLWELADKVADRESRLNEAATEIGSAPEDADVFARIEELHDESEAAKEQLEKVRSWSLWGSFASILAAIPIATAGGPVAAAPFIIVAAAAAAFSLQFYRRVSDAEAAESELLTEVGADSYLNFHVGRVNRLLSSDSGRKKLMNAAEEHRAAQAQWRLLAGDISVTWASEHRAEIEAAAAESHANQRLGVVARSTPEVASDVANDIGTSLRSHIEELATMGPGGEAFPVILDDPFSDVPSAAKAELLLLVRKLSENQQIIYLTEDPDVSAWAKLEAITETLRLIEPSASTEDDPSHPQRRRHVAA